MDDADFWIEMQREVHTALPWLAYADWLDEQGDIRGELFRVSRQLADQSPEAAGVPLLRMREFELLNEFGADWLEPHPHWTPDVLFHRGLMLPLLGPEQFLEEQSILGQPVIGMRFSGLPLGQQENNLVTVHRKKTLADLAVLRLHPPSIFPEDWVNRLLQSRHLGNLQELDLGDHPLYFPPSFDFDADRLPRLRSLTVSSSGGGGKRSGVRRLIESPLVEQLHTLNMTGQGGGEILRLILGERRADLPLQTLTIEHDRSFSAGWTEFLASLPCPRLETLDLGGMRLDAEGLTALATSPFSSTLRSLTCSPALHRNGEGVTVRLPNGLEEVLLIDPVLNTEQWQQLLAPTMSSLRTLRIQQRRLTQPNWTAVFRSFGRLENLTALHLEGLNLTPAIITSLFRRGQFPNLRRLRIGQFVSLDAVCLLMQQDLPSVIEFEVAIDPRSEEGSVNDIAGDLPLVRQLRSFDLRGPTRPVNELFSRFLAGEPNRLERLLIGGRPVSSAAGTGRSASPQLLRDTVSRLVESDLHSRLTQFELDARVLGLPPLLEAFNSRYGQARQFGHPRLSTATPQTEVW